MHCRERAGLPDAFCNSLDKLRYLGQCARSTPSKGAEAFQHSMEVESETVFLLLDAEKPFSQRPTSV